MSGLNPIIIIAILYNLAIIISIMIIDIIIATLRFDRRTSRSTLVIKPYEPGILPLNYVASKVLL